LTGAPGFTGYRLTPAAQAMLDRGARPPLKLWIMDGECSPDLRAILPVEMVNKVREGDQRFVAAAQGIVRWRLESD
jgi:hypothetical protein